MRIDVIGRNLELTDAIRQYAQTKAGKLTKYFDGLQAITVTFTKASPNHSTDCTAELVLDVVGHDDFVSHATGADPYAAVDIVMEKGERHLRDFKERLQDRKQDRKHTS